VREGNDSLAKAPGISKVSFEKGSVQFTIGSGRYIFTTAVEPPEATLGR
jgi:hypothetical protein